MNDAVIWPTETEQQRDAAIEAASTAISRGALVVLPTDTVYGVGADAFDGAAVAKLLEAKGRGREMPPPVLIGAATTLSALATQVPTYVQSLTDAFWPGPLTVVCHQQPSLTWDLGENRGTVAVRVPADEIALGILERTGPMAVSSANLTGAPAATDALAAQEMLGDLVEVYVDAGPSGTDVASTIVDCTGERPRVLRLGAIGVEELDAALAETGISVDTSVDTSPEPGPEASPDTTESAESPAASDAASDAESHAESDPGAAADA